MKATKNPVSVTRATNRPPSSGKHGIFGGGFLVNVLFPVPVFAEVPAIAVDHVVPADKQHGDGNKSATVSRTIKKSA